MAAETRVYGSTGDAVNVQVIAPATLSAGYTFDAIYNGVTFTVTVPEGGVVRGQRFIHPFVPEPLVAVPVSGKPGHTADIQGGIPIGRWRDNLFDCCRFGPLHPHFLNAWFCRSILMGQLLTRMKMTWLGRRTIGQAADYWRNTFRNVVILTVTFFVLMTITTTPQTMDPSMMAYNFTMYNETTGEILYNIDTSNSNLQPVILTYDDLSTLDKVKYTLNGWTSTLFALYSIYILIVIRATVRQVYSIPEENCLLFYRLRIFGEDTREGITCCGKSIGSVATDTGGVPIGWEDVCCSLCCPVCVVSQIARHTVNYNDKRAVCCNTVGVNGWDDDDAYARVPLENQEISTLLAV